MAEFINGVLVQTTPDIQQANGDPIVDMGEFGYLYEPDPNIKIGVNVLDVEFDVQEQAQLRHYTNPLNVRIDPEHDTVKMWAYHEASPLNVQIEVSRNDFLTMTMTLQPLNINIEPNKERVGLGFGKVGDPSAQEKS